MKKFIRKQLKDTKGLALLVLVIFLCILLQVSTMDIIFETTAQLKEANFMLALRNAENSAINENSPITNNLDQVVFNRLYNALNQHLQSQLSKKTYVCQGVIPPLQDLTESYGICDPVHLLDNLPGGQKQSIDYYSIMKPRDANARYTNPDYEYMIGEQKREAFN